MQFINHPIYMLTALVVGNLVIGYCACKLVVAVFKLSRRYYTCLGCAWAMRYAPIAVSKKFGYPIQQPFAAWWVAKFLIYAPFMFLPKGRCPMTTKVDLHFNDGRIVEFTTGVWTITYQVKHPPRSPDIEKESIITSSPNLL